MKKYQAHLFICQKCTIAKAPEDDCQEKALNLCLEVKKKTKALYPKDSNGPQVRVSKSGCLGQCEEGIAAVLYPSGKWFLNLTGDESEELVKAIVESLPDQ